MPNQCDDCKANPVDIARKTEGTPTAKLIAILEAHGITSAAELAEIVGISDRAVRKARNHSSGTVVPGGTTVPELQDRHGTTVPKAELQDRNSGADLAHAGITTRATKELPSEVSLTNRLTDSREREVSQSVDLPSAELKQAFNGSTENILADIQRWMNADRQHAVKWLTTLLSIAGSDAVLAAYGQLLESQTKGKLIADPIRYLGKTAPTLKGRASAGNKSADVLPFKVSVAMHPNARPRDEVMGAANA